MSLLCEFKKKQKQSHKSLRKEPKPYQGSNQRTDGWTSLCILEVALSQLKMRCKQKMQINDAENPTH